MNRLLLAAGLAVVGGALAYHQSSRFLTRELDDIPYQLGEAVLYLTIQDRVVNRVNMVSVLSSHLWWVETNLMLPHQRRTYRKALFDQLNQLVIV